MLKRKGQIGIVIVVILLIAIVLIGIYFYYSNDGYQVSYLEESTSSLNGRVVFAITDAAADLDSVSKVMITVDEVSAHSTTEGWTAVSSSSKTYDLIELKNNGEFAVIADEEIKVGSYDQLRLDISRVLVVDSNGEHEAKLPSSELKINSNLNVNENSTATATFDFIVDESLHITGNGKYILAPVVKVETRDNAEVQLKGNNRVEIKEGDIKTNVKVGMDVDGNVGTGLNIPSNVEIDLGSDGVISIGRGKSSSTVVNSSSNVGVGVGLYRY